MSDKNADLRQRLLDAQEMSPAMRDACHQELDAMLQHTLTTRTRLLLTSLLLAMFVFAAVGVRAMLLYRPGPILFGVWAIYTGVCAAGALWVGRSLWRGRFLWKSVIPVAEAFTLAAAAITVLALTHGLRTPADPSSTFGVLYALTFLIICIAWSLHGRIGASELAAREQMLRIECRLADLAERLEK